MKRTVIHGATMRDVQEQARQIKHVKLSQVMATKPSDTRGKRRAFYYQVIEMEQGE